MPAAQRTSWSLEVLAAILAGLILLLSGPSSAVAAEPSGREYRSSFGPDGTTASNFERIGAVGVDQQTGAIYVLDASAGALYKFDSEGHPLDFAGTAGYIAGNRISGLSPGTSRNESQVAVNSASHIIYVTEGHALKAFQADGEPAVFTGGPGLGTNEIGGFSKLLGVAVDANGAIYASDFGGTVNIYSPSGEPLTSFSAQEPASLAVSVSGNLYVTKWLGSGNSFTQFAPSEFPVTPATTYTAGSSVSPQSGFFVDIAMSPGNNGHLYLVETTFVSSRIGEYDESGAFLGSFAGPGESGALGNDSDGIGLFVGGKTLYAGSNDTNAGTSQVEMFAPPPACEGPSVIESSSAGEVTADSATLRARINPCSAATTYHFEYGAGDCSVTSCTVVPAGGASVGKGHEGVPVSQDLADLQPNTTYHYRVVSESSEGVTEGPDRTFRTQTSGLGFLLSDSRTWEMVSPPDKNGATIDPVVLIQAAADGNGLVYPVGGSIEVDPEGNRALEWSTILARRGAGGWRSKDLSPANGRAVPFLVGGFGEYGVFAPDLSTALLEPREGSNLSPQASERTPYLRENSEPPVYTPLVTGKAGFANVPPGTKFGGDPSSPRGEVHIAGATDDLSHVALWSVVPLVPGAPPSPQLSLYLWTADHLQPVSVLPPGEGGNIVSAQFIGSGGGSVRNAISTDGSRVFWSPGDYSENFGTAALYMRNMTAGETVRLDIVQSGASGAGQAHPAFQGATPDGSVVFFSDSQQLTPDTSPSGRDLYRCEIPVGSSGGCTSLTDLSAPAVGSGESAEVVGLASAVSDDGTRIYFVAKGVLDEAPNQFGDSAVAGEPNLYLWQAGQGVRFIASLSEEDSYDWGEGPADNVGFKYKMSAAGSPSGRYLAFMSQRSLSGYDSQDPATGEAAEEVFRYDAVEDDLQCVSCNPSGGSPAAVKVSGSMAPTNPRNLWSGQWVSAMLPEASVLENGGPSLYQPRSVLDNGRILFNAIDALVPADSNGEWDVYQFEPVGLGSCTSSSEGAAVVRSGGGCVGLVSSGTGNEESGFLDASASGDDVFFLTTAQLSVLDEDTINDVYDARVNGVPAVLRPVSECAGEACQPSLGPPNDPTPASEAFTGPGNSVRCSQGRRKVRHHGKVRCARHPTRKHKKHRRHRRAGKGRGAAK